MNIYISMLNIHFALQQIIRSSRMCLLAKFRATKFQYTSLKVGCYEETDCAISVCWKSIV